MNFLDLFLESDLADSDRFWFEVLLTLALGVVAPTHFAVKKLVLDRSVGADEEFTAVVEDELRSGRLRASDHRKLSVVLRKLPRELPSEDDLRKLLRPVARTAKPSQRVRYVLNSWLDGDASLETAARDLVRIADKIGVKWGVVKKAKIALRWLDVKRTGSFSVNPADDATPEIPDAPDEDLAAVCTEAKEAGAVRPTATAFVSKFAVRILNAAFALRAEEAEKTVREILGFELTDLGRAVEADPEKIAKRVRAKNVGDDSAWFAVWQKNLRARPALVATASEHFVPSDQRWIAIAAMSELVKARYGVAPEAKDIVDAFVDAVKADPEKMFTLSLRAVNRRDLVPSYEFTAALSTVGRMLAEAGKRFWSSVPKDVLKRMNEAAPDVVMLIISASGAENDPEARLEFVKAGILAPRTPEERAAIVEGKTPEEIVAAVVEKPTLLAEFDSAIVSRFGSLDAMLRTDPNLDEAFRDGLAKHFYGVSVRDFLDGKGNFPSQVAVVNFAHDLHTMKSVNLGDGSDLSEFLLRIIPPWNVKWGRLGPAAERKFPEILKTALKRRLTAEVVDALVQSAGSVLTAETLEMILDAAGPVALASAMRFASPRVRTLPGVEKLAPKILAKLRDRRARIDSVIRTLALIVGKPLTADARSELEKIALSEASHDLVEAFNVAVSLFDSVDSDSARDAAVIIGRVIADRIAKKEPGFVEDFFFTSLIRVIGAPSVDDSDELKKTATAVADAVASVAEDVAEGLARSGATARIARRASTPEAKEKLAAAALSRADALFESGKIRDVAEIVREANDSKKVANAAVAAISSVVEKVDELQPSDVEAVAEVLFTAAGVDEYDAIDDLISRAGEKGWVETVEKRLATYVAFEPVTRILTEDASQPIRPLVKLDPEKTGDLLRFNNFRVENVPERLPGEKWREYAERVRAAAERVELPPLRVTPLEEAEEDLERKSAEFHQRFYSGGRHGDIAVRFLKSFDVDLVSDEFVEFKQRYPDTVMRPVFHGTGSVSASMILRFGFRVMPEGFVKAGRMLGDGIYFSTVIDKVAQYVGDDKFTRWWGTKGYILEMEAVLGEEGTHYSKAGTGEENDGIISPEWCVFNPRAQLNIYRVHFVELVPKKEIDRLAKKYPLQESGGCSFFDVIAEAAAAPHSSVAKFVFMDGSIPLADGTPVPFEKYPLQRGFALGYSQRGPVLYVQNDIGDDSVTFVPFTAEFVKNDPENAWTKLKKLIS